MAKQLIGVVSSDKADKTIVVKISVKKSHPIYRKQFTESNKIMAHDEKNEAKIGDKVLIVETRPISSRKSFKLVQILDRPVLVVSKDDEGAPSK